VCARVERKQGRLVTRARQRANTPNNKQHPPKKAEVFEEVATMDHPFEGIPTVPPHKDVAHMAAYCDGCRYRVTCSPDWTAARLKQALWDGGIARANKAQDGEEGATPGIQRWQDIVSVDEDVDSERPEAPGGWGAAK
jgi:hypothetical protein